MSEFSAELTDAQREMSQEWLKKDAIVQAAQSLLQKIDPEITIEWQQEPAFDAGVRRVIVMKG